MDGSRPALRALIVGGSLGGLSAALYLRDAGCKVDVYERSPRPLEGQGAGIVLNPATVRYLVEHRAAALDDVSVSTRWLRYLDAAGEVAAEHPEPYRFTSYEALYRRLRDCLDGERYHLGHEVVDFQQDAGGVAIHLSGGGRERGDLLVCADGIRSAARARLVPGARLRYAGYVAWRGTVDQERLSDATVATLEQAITYHVLRRGHLLTYPIPRGGTDSAAGNLTNWLWYRNVAEGPDLDDLMRDRDGLRRPVTLPPGAVQDRHVAELRAAAGQRLPGPLRELVLATEHPFVQAVFDAEVPHMAFGRVCLIGDAAFVARPHAAVGTAKAAEDAYQLGRSVRAAGGDVPTALRLWEPGQLELARGVYARTREAGQRAQFDGTWRVGDPLPFGLYAAGDSCMVAG